MKYFCLLILFVVGPFVTGWAQYSLFYNQGIEEYNNLKFEDAINSFKAALLATDAPPNLTDVVNWQERAQNGYVEAIERERQIALDAKKAAEEARDREARARRIAEANQFGLLAKNDLEVGKDTNALILSYSALEVMDSLEISGSLRNAFGQASHDFFSQTQRSNLSPIYSILALDDPFSVVMESGSEGAISLFYLDIMQYREIGRHNAYLTSLQYAPTLNKLLSTDINGGIKMWDLETFQSTNYPSHEREVIEAAFSRQGAAFLTVSKDETSKLWNLTGQMKEQLPAQKGIPFDIDVSASGNFLIRSSRGEITVWNTEGRRLAELTNRGDFIQDAKLSPDGNYILTASADRTARIWNLEGRPIASLAHFLPLKSVVFSPKGDLILTQTKGNLAKVWDGQGQFIADLVDHQDQLTFAEFSPSGNFIVTGARDNTVKVWNTKGELLYTLDHETPPIAAHFSPDEQLVLTTAQGSNSRLWDQTGNMLRTIPLSGENTIPSIFSTDGQYVISVIDDQVINICPIPAVAKKMIEEEDPIPLSRVISVEKEYEVNLQAYWIE